MHLAKARDINVVVSKTVATKGFTNLVTVALKGEDDSEQRIAGTLLNGYGPRIVQINKFPVDVAPHGNLLFISHNDKPGIIGKVGTLLGENEVNIAAMQVGRKIVGGEAIMVLSVDKELDKNVIDALLKVTEINKAKQIEFK
jgi:D-3-phosphoglycerate dehydrogenase